MVVWRRRHDFAAAIGQDSSAKRKASSSVVEATAPTPEPGLADVVADLERRLDSLEERLRLREERAS